MPIMVDGQEVIDRAEFAALLGIGLHSAFDKRRQRARAAGEYFPPEYTRLHGHPYWLLSVAEEYVDSWVDNRPPQLIPA
jgi:hypothetical protein